MILDRFLETRMTSESAGSLQEPSRSFMEALGSTPTVSGVSINESTAEGIPAVYA